MPPSSRSGPLNSVRGSPSPVSRCAPRLYDFAGAPVCDFSSADLHFLELLSQHRTDFHSDLLRDGGTLQVLAKRIVDQCLIVAATGLANLIAEVIDDVSVKPNRDPNLFRRQRNDRTAFALA